MSTDFGHHVRQIRLAKGVTLKALGEAAGRSESWASNIETGKIAEPPYSVVVKMAQRLRVAPGEFYADIPEPLDDVLRRIGAFPLIENPAIELDQVVAAGRHGSWITQGVDDTHPRRRHRKVIPVLYLVRIQGDCLEPRASEGDIAVFDPDKPAENGNLVVVAHGDQALVKYLAEQDSMQLLLPLVGDPIMVEPGMRIVGVVREIRRDPGNAPSLRT